MCISIRCPLGWAKVSEAAIATTIAGGGQQPAPACLQGGPDLAVGCCCTQTKLVQAMLELRQITRWTNAWCHLRRQAVMGALCPLGQS